MKKKQKRKQPKQRKRKQRQNSLLLKRKLQKQKPQLQLKRLHPQKRLYVAESLHLPPAGQGWWLGRPPVNNQKSSLLFFSRGTKKLLFEFPINRNDQLDLILIKIITWFLVLFTSGRPRVACPMLSGVASGEKNQIKFSVFLVVHQKITFDQF